MRNVDTLRFLIDQANRMDDDTPKKVRKHVVDMLAEAVREAVGADLEVTGQGGRADKERSWWHLTVRRSFGYPCAVRIVSGALYRADAFNWISAEWPDAAETLLEAAACAARGDTPEVANIRAKLTAEQSPLPSFEELVTQAGGNALIGDAQVLAVWPDGSIGVDGRFCYARKIDLNGQLVARYELPSEFWGPAKATGARGMTYGDSVRAVWPDGKALVERSDGWLVSWPDGRSRVHEDLSVALDCDGECEQ